MGGIILSNSKNINMFLINGEVTGIIKCTMSNWTGVIYKVPRTKLTSDSITRRSELNQSGVYFLLGKEEDKDRNVVYIGQAGVRKNGNGVLSRLMEHSRNESKDYFNEVIILSTQTNSFGPTEISYLENKFTNLAKETNRYIVKNANEPTMGNVTEEKESELDEIIENTKMIIGTLGHRMFVPITKTENVDDKISSFERLYFKRKSGKSNRVLEAQCEVTDEGFVVLKGSMIEMFDSDSIPESLKEKRKEFIKNGIIKDGILMESQLFNSPTYAAAFIIGGHINGRYYWKDSSGTSLKDLEKRDTVID